MHALLVVALLVSADSQAVKQDSIAPKVTVADTGKTVAPSFNEEQVPFDSKGTIMELTKQDANKIGVFKDIEGFIKADAYKTSPSSYTLEISRKQDKKLIRMKKEYTESEFLSLQSQVDTFFTAHPKLDRSGRGIFALTSFWSAYAEWAPCVCVLIYHDGITFSATAATYLLTSAAGFFVPLALTSDKSVTMGQANLSWCWSRQGYGVGLLFADLMNSAGGAGAKFYYGSALAGGILGDLAGYTFANQHKLNAGNGSMLSEMGYWGAGYGALISSLIVPWGSGGEWPFKMIEASTLFGLGYGEYLWYKKNQAEYTYGDFLGFTTLGSLSIASSFNIVSYIWSNIDGEIGAKIMLGTAGALNAFGLWKGLQYYNNVDIDGLDGLTIAGGTMAGSLTGLGMAILASPDWHVFCSMIIGGGWAGYFVTQNAIIGQSKNKNSSTGFKLNFQPENLLGLWMSKEKHTSFSAPIVTVNF